MGCYHQLNSPSLKPNDTMYDTLMRPSAHFGLFLLANCLFFSGNSAAQHMNAADAPCHSPAPNTEQTQCFITASKAADNQLNQTYARVRQVLSPDEQGDLQQAQRLWLEFRDANCSAERNLYGSGTAAPMVYAACLEADTRQRTAELKTMYGWRLEKFGNKIE
jgi:uncharacterized protein YecT (DUF1311 family)